MSQKRPKLTIDEVGMRMRRAYAKRLVEVGRGHPSVFQPERDLPCIRQRAIGWIRQEPARRDYESDYWDWGK